MTLKPTTHSALLPLCFHVICSVEIVESLGNVVVLMQSSNEVAEIFVAVPNMQAEKHIFF